MHAKVSTEGDCVIVHLIGHLDVETAGSFRRACLEQLTDKRVIFSFRELSFVGSSGILPFLETMQDFAKVNRNRFKFCWVGSEFKKLLAATTLSVIEIYENENAAIAAFSAPSLSHSLLGASGVVAAPMHSQKHLAMETSDFPPQMPPMKVRVVTEGVNPIFTADEVETTSLSDGETDNEVEHDVVDV